jgi:hypothetical protein
LVVEEEAVLRQQLKVLMPYVLAEAEEEPRILEASILRLPSEFLRSLL